MVTYLRALQRGQGRPVAVPTATTQQLSMADFESANPARRGAAVYFAQGCQSCHGPEGNAPGNLALRGGGREATQAVREGRRGMPAYDQTQISDSQLADLESYMNALPRRGGFFDGGGAGEGGRQVGGEGGGG
jgi:mono/diheme cytochrome c family protein